MKALTHPREISIEEFDYPLENERIAKYPLPERDASKLLIYARGNMDEARYANIGDHLPASSLLVFNNSRVVEARLLFQKPSGGIIEIFALEPHEQYADITTAMNQTGQVFYKCLVGGASKWKHGMVLTKKVAHNGDILTLQAAITDRRPDCFVISLSWHPEDISFAQVLHYAGNMPIPPYLHRDAEESDTERYQTVYASADGSVAAPTAGLHFTSKLLEQLAAKGFTQAYTTLHVGAGTFMPVKSSTMDGHEMHAEFLEAGENLLIQLRDAAVVIPVGTTAMRTIESLYWMGVKAYKNPSVTLAELEMQQWEVYDELMKAPVNKGTALNALLQWMRQAGLRQLVVKTRIIIAPGYPFGICKGLITNFHQPKSTLLLLVAALIGDDWKRVYDYALKNDFRFLSYGDGSLLLV
jgi:S-adenosylmethionine:tRNA ribosyltransferase-isomerase